MSAKKLRNSKRNQSKPSRMSEFNLVRIDEKSVFPAAQNPKSTQTNDLDCY